MRRRLALRCWVIPLYLNGGLARSDARPGEGGYQLHAHSIELLNPAGEVLAWQADRP